jgi:CheY-like chemotaxis protein
MLELEANAKGLQLGLEYPSQVPRRLVGDAGRIRQVLVNLVGNAIKFTTRGEVRIRARCQPRDRASVIVYLSVEDTGIGIAKEDLSRIFAEFTQLDPAPGRRPSGIGLGLAISRRLVDLMGGEILVDSAPDRGSTFTVALPLEMDAAGVSLTSAPSADAVSQPPEKTFLGRRVLVAEDDAISQKVTARMLERLGCEVTIASNGKEAVQMATGDDFSLVFMDWRMPEMDGLQAACEIRHREGNSRHIPIVALTASALSDDRDRSSCSRRWNAGSARASLSSPFP